MKTIIITICLFLTFSLVNAQNIPNYSFENWDSTEAGCYLPTYWEPLFMFCTSPNVAKVSDAYDGNYAIKLYWSTIYSTLMGGSISSDFGITGKPSSFRLNVKGNFSHSSIFNASVILYKEGDIIGSAAFSMESAPSVFAQKGGNFSYIDENLTADSAWVILAIGGDSVNVEGDFLIIDNIQFSNEPLSVMDSKIGAAKVFPNPCNDNFAISTNQDLKIIELFDIAGRKILTQLIDNQPSTLVSVKELGAGIYFAQLRYRNGRNETVKLIISR